MAELQPVFEAAKLSPLAGTPFRTTGKRGVHSEHMGYLLAEMQTCRAPSRSGVVNKAQAWATLAQVPDPEVPVLSVVDLGIVREVEVGATTTASP